jgi:hypothetical protein
MPGDAGVLVVTRVRSTTTKCTRGRGCNGHPAFPTPSKGARDKCMTRAHGAARPRTRVWRVRVRRNLCEAMRRLTTGSVIPGWSHRVGALRRPMTGSGPDPESRDSGFDAEPVIGPRFARTRWHRPGMTALVYSRSLFTPESRLAMTMKRAHHTHGAAQENVAATLPNPDSSITTLSPAVSQMVLTRLPVSTISPAERPLPSEAR